MKSRILGISLAALATVALAGCAGGGGGGEATGEATTSDEPFTVVYVGGVTGNLASTTESDLKAVEAGVDYLNENGGIDGHPVTLEVLDSKSDPTEAVTVLQQRLTAEPKPNLIKAGIISPEALAILPVASRAGIASYSIGNSPLIDDIAAYPLNRSVTPTALQQVEVVHDYAVDQGFEKISLLAPENATGDALVASVDALFTDATVDVTRYSPTELDLTAAYERALSTSPEAIYADCIGQPCATLLQARANVPGALDVPVLGGSPLSASAGGPAAIASPEAIAQLQILLFNVQLQQPEAEQTENFKTFYSSLLAVDPEPTGVSAPAFAWDGLMMYAKAAAEAGSIEGADMVAAIDAMDWAPGDFVSYGNVSVDYDGESVFPAVPADGFAMVQASPLEAGLYPAENVFIPSK